MRSVAILTLALLLTGAWAQHVADVPNPRQTEGGWVVDMAGILTPDQKQQLEEADGSAAVPPVEAGAAGQVVAGALAGVTQGVEARARAGENDGQAVRTGRGAGSNSGGGAAPARA